MRFPDDNEGDPSMNVYRSGEFWSATAERAIKTFAQTVLAVIGIAGVTPADVDWKQVALAGAFGALASALTSIASASAGNPGPSLASEELVPPAKEA
jgi:hypothetical protein